MILLYHENYICASYLFDVVLVRESISDDDMVFIKVDLGEIALVQGRFIPPVK